MAEKITEKISYLTQICTAWDNSEQRMALRSEPRRYIAYDYIGIESWQSQYLRMLTYQAQTQLIQFPLWHAACRLSEQQYIGQSAVAVPTHGLWGFRNIGAVELWTDDQAGGVKYDLNYITANGALGLKKQLKSNWMADSTMAIPVFYGVLQQDSSYTNLQASATELTMNLELIQNQSAPTFPTAWDEFHDEKMPIESQFREGMPGYYFGAEVFRYMPQWEDDLSAKFTRNANRLDYNVGVFRFDLKSYNPTESRDIKFAGISRAEIYNMQRFFMRQKGRWKSFWVPTWLNDIELAGDQPSGQTYLLTKFNQFWKYYAKTSRRKNIILFYIDGSSEILSIAGYSTDDTGTYGKIYLDEPLKHDLRIKRVRMISFFARCRFASDDLTTDYETTGIATIQMSFQEVDA